jgi:Tfp pilus assembly protein PilZ
MTSRLLLISRDGPPCQAYRDALTRLSITFDHVSSLDTIPDYIRNTMYNGILLDVTTSARAKHEEKEQIRELSDQFPLLRLKWDVETEEIKTMFFGQTLGTHIDLETFITEHCALFLPRPIRFDRRKKLNFNALLSRSGSFDEDDVERANVIEISTQSCFIYSTSEWTHSEKVWLKIMELGETDVIETQVAWITHWGVPMQLPGVELTFVRVSEGMKNRIHGWTNNQLVTND